MEAKVQELIEILKRNDKFVPIAPTMKDVGNDSMNNANFQNSKQRKGHGTGNSKQNKKQIKKNHRLLLNLWIIKLEEAIEQIQ